MKKIVYLFLIILVCGCSDKAEEEIIKANGELICIYKENRTNENTIYTSYYLYEYTDQGILKNVVNTEKIEYDNTSDDTKEYYKDSLNEVLKEYKDIKGITVTNEVNDKYLSFDVNMDISKMDDKTKDIYKANDDRITTSKYFTSLGYTCE